MTSRRLQAAGSVIKKKLHVYKAICRMQRSYESGRRGSIVKIMLVQEHSFFQADRQRGTGKVCPVCVKIMLILSEPLEFQRLSPKKPKCELCN